MDFFESSWAFECPFPSSALLEPEEDDAETQGITDASEVVDGLGEAEGNAESLRRALTSRQSQGSGPEGTRAMKWPRV